MDLLRFATAGSVDDGKSTMIGRLLYDTKTIFEDQLEAVERTSRAMGVDFTNLALLTDGLRAEREQGITIDVAYRYFATPKRKFIIADTPGHIQYTRNMVTGASTADLAIVLVDARNGMVEQSRRHAFIVTLLRVPHLVVAVNKMDLVDYAQDVYEEIRGEFAAFASKLSVPDLTVIPIAALHGDNVVSRSDKMPWYDGPSLLHHLENVHIASDRNMTDVRFPVQYVIRPQSSEHHDYRGYAGTVAGGVLKPGDDVVVLPSGFETRIASIDSEDGPVDEAFPPMAVTLRLEDDLDVSRGDMICRPAQCGHRAPGSRRHGVLDVGRSARPRAEARGQAHDALGARGRERPPVPARREHPASRRVGRQLALNDIGRIHLRTTAPLFVDDYRRNRATGGFILIDEATNDTVAAGMVVDTDSACVSEGQRRRSGQVPQPTRRSRSVRRSPRASRCRPSCRRSPGGGVAHSRRSRR